jgi:hypothetical protein
MSGGCTGRQPVRGWVSVLDAGASIAMKCASHPPGSNSARAVAMLAATIGEPKRGATTQRPGAACTNSRRPGVIEDAHNG